MAKYYVRGKLVRNTTTVNVSATVEADSEGTALMLARTQIYSTRPTYRDWDLEIISVQRK